MKASVGLALPLLPCLFTFPASVPRMVSFVHLVVHLLTVCKWELQTKDRNLACVSRNCIQFKLPRKPATITLIDSFSFFEVHLNTRSQLIPSQVRKAVFDALENAYSKFKYNNSTAGGRLFLRMWLLITTCSYTIY